MARVVLGVVFLSLVLGFCFGQEPMSPCLSSRATNYDYTSQNNGACQLGPIGGTMLPFAQYVAAPNEAFWNNSRACGECFEVTGPSGTVTVVVADLCPVQGNPVCDGKIIHFDLGTKATFGMIAPTNAGVVLDTIKKIACPVSGNIGAKLVPGTSQYYVGIIFYNHKVGISTAEIQPTGSGTFYSMNRNSNQFEYNANNGKPVISSGTYNVRLTGVTGEQVTVLMDSFAPGGTVISTVQFAAPPSGFGGSSATPCEPHPPSDVIFDDYLYNGNGASSNAWKDYSFNTNNNLASTNSPYLGSYCMSSQLGAFGGIQLGRDSIDVTWGGIFTHLSFAIRADSDYSSIGVSWDGGPPEVSLTITTSWTVYNLSLTADMSAPAGIGNTAPLVFKNNAGSSSPTIYIDELVFLPRNGGAYINAAFPAGSSSSNGGGSSEASGLQRVPLFVLLVVALVCLFILL